MKTLGFETVSELANCLDGFANGCLFRGQTREHLNGDKQPSLSSSFSRKGCVPPRMLKWSHYGRKILQSFVTNFDEQTDLATDQAILQHYGWRSFFVDVSSNPAVACWFAGHTCECKTVLNLAEDCWEDPAMLIHEQASYKETEGTGVVYVISKKALRARSVQAVDLREIATANGNPRFVAQDAWMVGPLDAELPSDCIAAKLFAPMSILREYAAQSKIGSQRDLFPGPDKDPVLASLLALPWIHRPVEGDDDPYQLHYFERSLPLPEYGWEPVKRYSANVAFYYPFWLANEHGPHTPFKDSTYLLTEEATFYGVADLEALRFPTVMSLLRTRGPLLIEMDGLMVYPHSSRPNEFGKGVLVISEGDNVVCLSEVLVSYQGMKPAGYGLAAGRSYEVLADGSWRHKPQKGDCPCGKDAIHSHHLVVVSHVESMLTEQNFKETRPGVLACKGVDSSANLRIIKESDDVNVPYFADVRTAAD